MSRTDFDRASAQKMEIREKFHRQIYYGQQYVTQYPDSETVTVFSPVVNRGLRQGQSTVGYFGIRRRHGALTENKFTYYDINYTPQTGVTKIKSIVKFGSLYSYEDIRTISGVVSQNRGCNWGLADPPAILLLNLTNACKAKVLAKVKDQDVNLANMYGERHQSMQMIADAFKRMGQAGNHLRKGDWQGAASSLGVKLRRGARPRKGSTQSEAFANGWLELNYGWLPLASDVYGASQFLRKSFTSSKTQTSRSVAEEKLNNSSSSSSPYKTVGTVIDEKSYELSCKAVVHHRRRTGVVPYLVQLGITNPLATGWELTKYSFVVDWAFGVSNYLNILDTGFGSDFVSGCITTAKRVQHSRSWSIHGYSNSTTWNDEEFSEKDEAFYLWREAMSGFAYPSLPAFKDPLSAQHVANAVALMKQALR